MQPPVPKGLLRGIVHKIASGAAFIILHEPKPSKMTEDMYVEASALKDAQNGDEVLIQVQQSHGGVVAARHRHRYAPAGDESVRRHLLKKMAPAGSRSTAPTLTSRSRSAIRAKGAVNEDKVVIEMLRFPTAEHPRRSGPDEGAGPHGEVGVDTE